MQKNTYLHKDFLEIRRLFKTHLIILLIITLSYIANYGLNLYLAQLLTPKDYGQIAVVFQFLVFFVPFALFGTELAVMRFLPMYIQRGENQKISGFLRWLTKMYFLTTLVLLILGGILVLIISYFHKPDSEMYGKYHILLFSFWLIPLFSLVILLSQIMQALKRYNLSAIFSGFGLSLLIIACIAAFLSFFQDIWLGFYQARFSVVICIGLACLITIGFELYSLYYLIPKEYLVSRYEVETKRWLRNSFEMMSSTVVFGGLMAVDIFMLQIIGKNEADVAHFAAIVVIASSMAVFGSAVDLLVNPLISPCIESENHKHLQSITDVMNAFKVIPAICISLLVCIFGKPLLSHFGESFASAYHSLIVITFSFFIGMCLSASGPLLLFSGHQRQNVYLSVSQLLFIIIFDFIFIPLYHLKGAVYVLGASILISGLIRTYLARRYLKIHSFYFI